MRAPYVLLALVLTGCGEAGRPIRHANDSAASSVILGLQDTIATGSRSSPTAAPVLDEDLACRDTTFHNPDPGTLVRDYVARDASGEFLGTSSFWLSATECSGEGTDEALAAANYAIDSLGVRNDTARFAVTYHFLGTLVQSDHGFAPDVHTTTDSFVVVHRRYGWRIVGQHDTPILLPAAAKARWTLSSDDSLRLDSAVRESANRVVPN